MREILFKAKRIDNGEWVEGCYIHTDQKNEFEHRIQPFDPQRFAPPIKIDTLCQYIGSIDKNGNKIWENDIIIADSRMFTVHYYEPFAMYMLKGIGHGGGTNGMNVQLANSEVIGNIFDNPELLVTTEN